MSSAFVFGVSSLDLDHVRSLPPFNLKLQGATVLHLGFDLLGLDRTRETESLAEATGLKERLMHSVLVELDRLSVTAENGNDVAVNGRKSARGGPKSRCEGERSAKGLSVGRSVFTHPLR